MGGGGEHSRRQASQVGRGVEVKGGWSFSRGRTPAEGRGSSSSGDRIGMSRVGMGAWASRWAPPKEGLGKGKGNWSPST